ncbi:MAG: acetylornithine/succinylornithine family transaminase [Trueperaceae bacterium]|nr:acetylornithine/succinylornithine family transaminase [Trueperaceae bacterium]
MSFEEPHASRTASILERDARRNSGLWSPSAAFVRGEGVRLYDADGNTYLDLMAGIAVASLGHAHPDLTRAICEQAGRLTVSPQNLANDVRTDFLEALFELAPAPLARAFLCSSGSEANEAAIKWARTATGRTRFVAFKRGFSGRTLGALPLTWTKAYREPFEPLATQVDFVPYGDAAALEEAVGDETAAVLMEPVQGEGGIHPADEQVVQAARRVTRERGALLIFDEIQSGAGRTGRFLAHEHFGVEADAVTMAKGLGGGVPIGALLMSEEVARSMPKGGHGTTFGGNPLASAAGLAVVNALKGGLLAHVREVGEHFRDGLDRLAGEEPRIREVRGMGLMLGVELKEKVAPLLDALRARGVLAINAGPTVLRLVPPLVITRGEVDEALEALRGALADSAGTA